MTARILLPLLLGTSLVACTTQSTPVAVTPPAPPLVSGIDLEYMNTEVRPGDDFFAYANGGWIDNTEIPADRGSYGSFTVLHEQSQADVRAIIEESAAASPTPGSDEQRVGDLYSSYMDQETRDALGVQPLQSWFAKIDAIADAQDLAKFFARANKAGIDLPFSLNQYADFKDPNTYMMYTFQGGLGLPDREYYFKEGDKSEEIRVEYKAHIEKMLSLADIDDPASKAAAIYALEASMASEHMLKEQTRDMVALYNKVPLPELDTVMAQFDWETYLIEAGIQDIDGLVITQLDHMTALDDIIAATDVSLWRDYLKWRVIDHGAARLSADLDKQNFYFFGKVLLGTEEQQPHWRRAVNVVNGTLGEVVGKVYVKRHFPPAAKARMGELVDNLIKAYEISIRDLDWMSEETRVEALDKLSKFRPKIGYPDEWEDYSQLEIKADDLYGNLQRASELQYAKNLARQTGPVDRGEWAMTPQTVNAYYNPPLNEIVFPAAILQPPFFNLEADDAVNYGAIGAVIGHEIGHGFDDAGSTFDGDGVLRNWWTDSDREEFERRTKKLIAQYSDFAPFPDLSVNGEFTLGENIGDLGGLSIGLLAYQLSLEDQEAPVIDGFTGIQRVFLGYAQVWRNKYRDASLRNLINTDPHSPSMYRANGAVRNVPEFYTSFGVEPDDTLYLAPEDRVKIW